MRLVYDRILSACILYNSISWRARIVSWVRVRLVYLQLPGRLELPWCSVIQGSTMCKERLSNVCFCRPVRRGVRAKRSERYILIPWYLRLAPTTSHLARGPPLSSGSYHAATITVIPLDCGWTMLNLMSRSDWQIRQSIALRYRCLLVMFMQKPVAHVKSPWPLVAAPRS